MLRTFLQISQVLYKTVFNLKTNKSISEEILCYFVVHLVKMFSECITS